MKRSASYLLLLSIAIPLSIYSGGSPARVAGKLPEVAAAVHALKGLPKGTSPRVATRQLGGAYIKPRGMRVALGLAGALRPRPAAVGWGSVGEMFLVHPQGTPAALPEALHEGVGEIRTTGAGLSMKLAPVESERAQIVRGPEMRPRIVPLEGKTKEIVLPEESQVAESVPRMVFASWNFSGPAFVHNLRRGYVVSDFKKITGGIRQFAEQMMPASLGRPRLMATEEVVPEVQQGALVPMRSTPETQELITASRGKILGVIKIEPEGLPPSVVTWELPVVGGSHAVRVALRDGMRNLLAEIPELKSPTTHVSFSLMGDAAVTRRLFARAIQPAVLPAAQAAPRLRILPTTGEQPVVRPKISVAPQPAGTAFIPAAQERRRIPRLPAPSAPIGAAVAPQISEQQQVLAEPAGPVVPVPPVVAVPQVVAAPELPMQVALPGAPLLVVPEVPAGSPVVQAGPFLPAVPEEPVEQPGAVPMAEVPGLPGVVVPQIVPAPEFPMEVAIPGAPEVGREVPAEPPVEHVASAPVVAFEVRAPEASMISSRPTTQRAVRRGRWFPKLQAKKEKRKRAMRKKRRRRPSRRKRMKKKSAVRRLPQRLASCVGCCP